MSRQSKFYITTPIYYVNASPHIGHTYTTVAADVLARFHRLLGDRTFFLTGTDEHGAKIAERAAEEGKEPKQFVDDIAAKFQSVWKSLDISFDRFIRTTEAEHKQAIRRAVESMVKKGDIYKDKYEGLYCQGCEQFKNEKDLVNGLCPDHKIKPVLMSEEAYMFRQSKYQKEILAKIKNDEFKIRPLERKNEMVSFYENEGLKDVAFSRQKVKWGILFPGDDTHTIYVWADALLNYLTGLGWQGPSASSGQAPEFWPPDIQLMSKDILRVHSSIWPAMLLSLEIPLPKQLFIHGYFLIDSQKMSKSLGNVISPEQLIERYGVDGARYLLMSATSFGSDGDIGFKFFDEKYNADLANGLGNLIARVSTLLEKNEIEIDLHHDGDKQLADEYYQAMEILRFDEALKTIWRKIAECDESLSDKKPWKLEDKAEITAVLMPIAQNILHLAELLKPFMPGTADRIIEQFSQKQVRKTESLFVRIV